jgi:adenine-specific DNA-methyltransferase
MKAPISDQKLRGGYYTPERIAHFLADWAIRSGSDSVLEPGCGDGNILTAAATALMARGGRRDRIAGQIQGIEIDPREAEKAMGRLASLDFPPADNIWTGDFLDYCEQHLFDERRFDAAVGNPPFIRYQNFQEAPRSVAFRLLKYAGLRPTRLMNAWVPFVVASTLMLKPDMASPLRIEKFSAQIEAAYTSRYKGLPPHA